MKVAYIIRTNHDGNIGVFTSKKNVFNAIQRLMTEGYENAKLDIDEDNQPTPTYANICKELQSWGCQLYTDDGGSIEVQKFWVNNF